MSNEPPQALLCNADGPINGHAIAGLEAALSAQAAEIARLMNALARGVCIIAYECGYDFDLTVRWLSEQTDEHHVVHIGGESLSFDKDSLATAEAALSKIREARKP